MVAKNVVDKQERNDNDQVTLVLSEKQAEALEKVIEDRIWWDEASRRIKNVAIVGGVLFGLLAALAAWWPWITRIVQLIIKDVPTS